MSKHIFINLMVHDLHQAEQFYLSIGFQTIQTFNFEDQRCVAWDDNIYVMLQCRTFFSKHLHKPTMPAFNGVTHTFTLPLPDQNSVDELTEKAIQAGATELLPMIQDEWVYVRTIEDADGYCWGFLHLKKHTL